MHEVRAVLARAWISCCLHRFGTQVESRETGVSTKYKISHRLYRWSQIVLAHNL
jgi:hypothetical protein